MLLPTSHFSPLAVHHFPHIPSGTGPTFSAAVHGQQMLPRTDDDRVLGYKHNLGSVPGPGIHPRWSHGETSCMHAD